MGRIEEIISALNNENREVFLSYRSTQVDFAYRLFNELHENNQITTWFDKDVLHENIGDQYTELIHAAIEKAKVFLFLYSRDAEVSKFIIKEEIGYALKSEKKVLCFPIDEVDFENMNPALSALIQQREWINKDSEAAHCLGIQEEVAGEVLRQEKASLTSGCHASTSIYTDKNLYLIRVQVQKALGRSTTIGNYHVISNSGEDGSQYKEGELTLRILPLSFTISVPEEKKKRLTDLKFYTPVQDNDDENADEKIRMKGEVDRLLESVSPDEQQIKNILFGFIHKNYRLEEIYDWLKEHMPDSLPASSSKENFTTDVFLSVVANQTADWFIHEKDDLKKGHFNGAMTGVYKVLEDPIPNIERHLTTIDLYYSDYFTFRCMERVYHILCSVRDCFGEISRIDVEDYCPFFCSLGLGGFIITNQPHSQRLVWVKRGKSIAASDLWHFSYDETSNIYKDSFRDDKGSIKVEDRIVLLDPQKYLLRGIEEEIGLKPESIKQQCGIFELGLIKCDRLEMEILSYAVYDCPDEPSLTAQFNDHSKRALDAHNEVARLDFVPLISSTYKYTGRFLTPESHYLSQYLNQHFSTFEKNQSANQISDNVEVGNNVKIGKGCLIESHSYLGDNCVIGEQCKIHRNVFIDKNVSIGSYVKIQNNNSIYEGVTLKDGVFIGTNVCFINDSHPRSIKDDGKPITCNDWEMEYTIVEKGASIGAGAVIMCGITIGEGAMVAAGAVVLESVPDKAMVAGNPARIKKRKIPY